MLKGASGIFTDKSLFFYTNTISLALIKETSGARLDYKIITDIARQNDLEPLDLFTFCTQALNKSLNI